ncbi:MAG: hypothetical protein ABSC50_09595 [Candidatus Bathyarchaeia archaeon]
MPGSVGSLKHGNAIQHRKNSAVVEAFISEGNGLYLVVGRLTRKVEFGCDYCGAIIVAASPDDQHTILRLEKEGESIERKIRCPNPKCGKENTRHWVKEAGPAMFTG